LTTFSRAYKKMFNPDKIFVGQENTLEEKKYLEFLKLANSQVKINGEISKEEI